MNTQKKSQNFNHITLETPYVAASYVNYFWFSFTSLFLLKTLQILAGPNGFSKNFQGLLAHNVIMFNEAA